MSYNLPDKFDEFVDSRKNGFMNALNFKREGGKIAGCLCTYTPLEIMKAGGMATVSLCGTSNETVPAAEKILPSNICPLIKSTFGFALTDKCPYTYFSDLIIGETTCDGKKKMYELLGQIKDVHILQLPQGKGRDYYKDIWYEECKFLKEKIEDKFDVEITDEDLRRAARQENELRELLVELYQLQMNQPPVMRGSDIILAKHKGEFAFDIENQKKIIRKSIDEAREAYFDKGERPVSENDKRILLTGCPSSGVIKKVGMVIESNGGVIVCSDDCGGERTCSQMVDTEADNILKAISDRYMEINCSVFTPNDARMENTLDMVEKYKVDGVVEMVLQGCHTFSIEAHTMEKAVKDAGIPYMKLETDYSEADSGQIETRLAAFIEML